MYNRLFYIYLFFQRYNMIYNERRERYFELEFE